MSFNYQKAQKYKFTTNLAQLPRFLKLLIITQFLPKEKIITTLQFYQNSDLSLSIPNKILNSNNAKNEHNKQVKEKISKKHPGIITHKTPPLGERENPSS